MTQSANVPMEFLSISVKIKSVTHITISLLDDKRRMCTLYIAKNNPATKEYMKSLIGLIKSIGRYLTQIQNKIVSTISFFAILYKNGNIRLFHNSK